MRNERKHFLKKKRATSNGGCRSERETFDSILLPAAVLCRRDLRPRGIDVYMYASPLKGFYKRGATRILKTLSASASLHTFTDSSRRGGATLLYLLPQTVEIF